MIYEIAEDVKKTLENKCDAYEIYIDETKAIELDSLKDELNFAKEEIELGLGIRVIKDNRQGFAFTSNMDQIKETSLKAVENTKLTKADDNYAFAEVEKVNDVKKVYDKKFDDLNVDESVEFLKNAIAVASDDGCEVTGAGFSASGGRSLIVNSNGVSIEDIGTGFGLGLGLSSLESEPPPPPQAVRAIAESIATVSLLNFNIFIKPHYSCRSSGSLRSPASLSSDTRWLPQYLQLHWYRKFHRH